MKKIIIPLLIIVAVAAISTACIGNSCIVKAEEVTLRVHDPIEINGNTEFTREKDMTFSPHELGDSTTYKVTINKAASDIAGNNIRAPRTGGAAPPPTDPDNDGLYEDINGNGKEDFDDVVCFFENLEWAEKNQPCEGFDFNKNGRIDFDDVVKLFEEI